MIGLHKTMSNEEYHADNAISRSGIMMFSESPYKYWANYINPFRQPKKSTPAMEFGSTFHTFVLEPRLFGEQYTMEPEKVLLKDVGREKYDAYKKLLKDMGKDEKIFISSQDMTLLFNMRGALERHKEAWDLIQGAVYEQSYFWEDKESGLLIKARPDILHSNMIVDLKTCVSADSRSFQRTMIDSGYHIQGAMIRDAVRELEGRDIPNVINICIEKTYPWSIGIKIISEEALKEGQKRYKNTLIEMKSALENNYFPDYEIETIGLPSWY